MYKWPRLFALIRNRSVVAYGCQFDNGKCCVCWLGEHSSMVIWDSIDSLKSINGHSNTTFVFEN
jgi:hypothetical protein